MLRKAHKSSKHFSEKKNGLQIVLEHITFMRKEKNPDTTIIKL